MNEINITEQKRYEQVGQDWYMIGDNFRCLANLTPDEIAKMRKEVNEKK